MENPAPPPPPQQREEDGGTMGAVVLGVDMGVHSPRGANKIKKKLMKVPGTYYCARAITVSIEIICCMHACLIRCF